MPGAIQKTRVPSESQMKTQWASNEDRPVHRVYYECSRCRYKIFSAQRCGPKHLECYECGNMMPWKPVQYR